MSNEVEIPSTPRNKALSEIVQRRVELEGRWARDYDDTLLRRDWSGRLQSYVNLIDDGYATEFQIRQRLIYIAATALAGIEAIDRKAERGEG